MVWIVIKPFIDILETIGGICFRITSFLRQAANLWKSRQKIRESLLAHLLPNGSQVNIADGFPMPVCGFRRALLAKPFREDATYGYCAAKAPAYYGLKGHLLIDLSGIIVDCTVAPANIDECEISIRISVAMQGPNLHR
ncbi:MAG: transposase [Lentisphaeria bacterium]|nr:transposase [Lentisphaeria bacterium]